MESAQHSGADHLRPVEKLEGAGDLEEADGKGDRDRIGGDIGEEQSDQVLNCTAESAIVECRELLVTTLRTVPSVDNLDSLRYL